MNRTLIFVVLVAAIATGSVYATESAFGPGCELADSLLKIFDNPGQERVVVVENWTGHPVRVWCASEDERIRHNGKDYIDLKDEQAMGWSFKKHEPCNKLFWCTFCYKNQKRAWNVYDAKWEELEYDSVPKNGLLRWRIVEDSVRWEYESLQKGWDFESWPSQGSC